MIALALAGMVAGAACGDGEDRPGQVTSENASGSASGSGSGSVSSSGAGGESEAEGEDAYTPSTDVTQHAAIGDDVATIKSALAVAKEGKAVDWDAVERTWAEGGASSRDDGTKRTLKALVDAPDIVRVVEAAIAGGPSDAVRAQTVEKGITVLLARKVVDEVEGGTPHNVDEAYAFFTAKGNGPAATADKRAADFELGAGVRKTIVTALAKAQAAATSGDHAALQAAGDEVREGLDYVFYLATFKYLAAEDEIGRAEGAAFYLGIAPAVRKADASADEAITSAFASGDADSGRAALHRSAVLTALGVDDAERVD